MIARFLILALFTCACLHLQAQVNIITTIAGTDSAGYSGDGGPATDAEFNYPFEICFDKSGNLLVSDVFNNRIRKIELATGIVSTIAGTGTGGFSGDGSAATNAEIWIPQGICIDDTGNIYFADAANRRIRKISASTGIITTVVGNGVSGDAGDGSLATSAEIIYPWGLFHDKHGNLFFSDANANKIRKVDSEGIITTVAGNGGTGYYGDGSPATDAEFRFPAGVALDSSCNIIICDGLNYAIRKVDAATGIITTIAGNGVSGYSGNGSLAKNAQISEAAGIFIDKNQNIYFAEWPNGVIRKIDAATGIISTVAGSGTDGFSGDGGSATNAKMIPGDLCIDSFGTIYITDYVPNSRVRMVYNPKLGTSPLPSPQVERGLYPNPARDVVTVDGAEGDEVVIYDMVGRQFDKLTMTGHKETVNISGLQPGVYVVQVINEDGEKKIFKVVKE